MSAESDRLDTIDDYLSGRLVADQLDDFEIELLVNEELQNEVNMQLAFRQGLALESEALSKIEPPTMISRLDTVVRSRVWAYAASVMVLVGGVSMVQQGGPNTYDAMQQVDLVYVERTRAGNDPDVSLSSMRPQMLSIDAIEFVDKPVTVRVTSQSGDEALSVSGLVPSDDGVLNVVVPGLPKGSFQLVLEHQQEQTTYNLVVL